MIKYNVCLDPGLPSLLRILGGVQVPHSHRQPRTFVYSRAQSYDIHIKSYTATCT